MKSILNVNLRKNAKEGGKKGENEKKSVRVWSSLQGLNAARSLQ